MKLWRTNKSTKKLLRMREELFQVLEATQIRRNNFQDIGEKLKELARSAMNEPAARIHPVEA